MKTKNLNNVLFKITSYLAILFVLLTSMVSASFNVKAEDSTLNFEKTSPLEDLQADESFDISKYPYGQKGQTKIVKFYEYCYSFDSAKNQNFTLFIYVYNPSGEELIDNTYLNSVQMAVGYNKEGKPNDYKKFNLKLCSVSEGDYARLFYKFKVIDKNNEIYANLNSHERRYDVSGVELLSANALNSSDKDVSTTYFYSGYAKGYGPNNVTESTLTCRTEGLETLNLEVKATQYRPEGTNENGKFTQDSLNSVYFAVPKEMVEKNGVLTKIKAQWLDAVLKPALVTGNEEAYKAILDYLGKEDLTNLEYAYIGNYQFIEAGWSGCEVRYEGDLSFGAKGVVNYIEREETGETINPLYLMFPTDFSQNSADDWVVKSEEIKQKVAEASAIYGGELVNGKYSKCLFESVANEWTVAEISADKEFDLRSEVLSQNWFQKWFGTGTWHVETFDGIKAIYDVKEEELEGTPEEVCNRLYISTSDYEDFIEFYEDNKEDNVIYLFRYQQNEYFAQEASLFKTYVARNGEKYFAPGGLGFTSGIIDTNAYFFKGMVNLDFDIIQLTFNLKGKETVIPVVADPIDVFHEATPPPFSTRDVNYIWVLVVVAVVFVLVLIIKFSKGRR